MFERVKKWYLLGLWSEKMVEEAVQKGLLTMKEKDSILGDGAK